ncbi:MAG: rhomboid family intramembrane serine protease [Sphingomonas sp.]|nr:rhomboid family intramembrane serine protease [Sphingomonas sp.]
MQRFPATTLIAGVTIVCSALLILTPALGSYAVLGGFVPASVTQAVDGPDGLPLVPWFLSPLTATLIHAGWTHLAFNLLMLVVCGSQLERALGPRLVALLYIVGAYAAALGEWALQPGSLTPMIGASGAVSALIGGYALLFSSPKMARTINVLWMAAAWIGLQTLYGLVAGLGGATLAVGAQVGGFLAGLALARPLLLWHYRRA